MTKQNVAPFVTRKVNPVPATPLTEEVVAHIQAVATDLIKSPCFSESDLEDICQELSMAVSLAFDHYDCRRSSYYTFAQGVIRTARLNLYRGYKDRSRIGLNEVSIEEMPDSISGLIDENAIPPDEIMERRELIAQVRAILPTLSLFHQEICEKIMAGMPVSEIAARLNMTRSQFYHRVLPELQKIFKEKLDF